MRVAMFTTWRVACGISEYSMNLVEALRSLGHDVRVFTNFANGNHAPVYGDDLPDYVEPAFAVEVWQEYGGQTAQILRDIDADVLHIQFQGSLYPQPYIEQLLQIAKSRGITTVVTFHDNAIWHGYNFANIDVAIAHRLDILHQPCRRVLLPMGLPYKKPSFVGFGLGRNRTDLIAPQLDEIGFDYTMLNWQRWITQAELLNELRSHDGTILFYDEVGCAGSSSAARIAIAARRPLFLNKVTWFNELMQNTPPNVFFYDNPKHLQDMVKGMFSNDFIDSTNWQKVAEGHVDNAYKSNG